MNPEDGKRMGLFLKKHGGRIELADEEQIRVAFSRASKAHSFYQDMIDHLSWKGIVQSNKTVILYPKMNGADRG